MVSVEKNREKLPDGDAQGQLVRITHDRIVATDKDSKQTFAASYKLNASNIPWIITMRSVLDQAGVESCGLVKREVDMVWLIYQHTGGDISSTQSNGTASIWKPLRFRTTDSEGGN